MSKFQTMFWGYTRAEQAPVFRNAFTIPITPLSLTSPWPLKQQLAFFFVTFSLGSCDNIIKRNLMFKGLMPEMKD